VSRFNQRAVRTLLTVSLLVVILSCGGGGGSSNNPPGNGPTTPPGDITADFASRQAPRFPVPAGMFGASLGFTGNGFFRNQGALSTLTQGGITSLRINADLQNIFNTRTPDWTQIDPQLSNLSAAGIHPMVVMGFTPFWLQPGSNPCGTISPPYHGAPTNVNAWAELTASFVAHVNQSFPGLAQDYEIWNEPDNASGLCTDVNSDQVRRDTYMAMYAAAASAMRAQATADRVQIRIGGPSLTTVGLAPFWLPTFLSDPSTAPNVDFVSYHHYLAGNAAITTGLTWNDNTKTQSVVGRTQDPAIGVSARYVQMATLVHQGLQPNASATPIFLDEYNITASFEPDCCRNSPTFAPLWNTMVVQDALNSVFSGASAVPAGLMYFAAQAFFPTTTVGATWFCLIGTIDARMDCAYDPANAQPYPQYYAYALIAGSNFLGLNAGGFMANSVSVQNAASGLIVTSFYTGNKLAVVITNPTNSDFNNITVKAEHPGAIGAQGTLYLLNSSNPHISQQSVSLTNVSDGTTATISVPRLSVVAIGVPTS
jgi:hypothetical protein